MTVTIRRSAVSSNNENAQPAVLDEALIEILGFPELMAYWEPKLATIQGRVSSKPFAWMDRSRQIALKPIEAGYAPAVVMSSDNSPYLRFGYGPGFKGETLDDTHNGGLEVSGGISMFERLKGFTLAAVVRVPVVGGVAGATPGGSIIGNKLNQAEAFNASTNGRWSGLDIGYGSTVLGNPRICLNGDAVYYGASAGTGSQDLRDGTWHVIVGYFDYAGGISPQALGLRVDGVDRGSSNPMTSVARDLNTTGGSLALRVGATGLPGTAPTAPAKMDMRDLGVFSGRLSLEKIQKIEAALKAKYNL